MVYSGKIHSALKEIEKNKLDKLDKKINEIKINESTYNWNNFSLKHFASKIKLEKKLEADVEKEIRDLLVEKYSIRKNSENLFLHSLYFNAFSWAVSREDITYEKFISKINKTKEYIDEGFTNRAILEEWIKEINFDRSNLSQVSDYFFSGKSVQPVHIAEGLPIIRDKWEKEILDSLNDNHVVCIKTSSGQGKSTLAWRVAYELQKTYKILELNYCKSINEIAEIKSILKEYCEVGHIPLVIIDGLNDNTEYWIELVKRTLDLPIKFIITTREEDWIKYGTMGVKIKHIDINMDKEEAEQIFNKLLKNKQINTVINWQTAWEKVKEKKLLIEYIYLLTKGEMISDRIQSQIHQMQKDKEYNKMEILMQIAFCDICGVKLNTKKLLNSLNITLSEKQHILTSLDKEYQILIEDKKFVEGLHPVRSQHIINYISTQISISEIIKKLLPIIQENELNIFIDKSFQEIENKIQRNEITTEFVEIAKNKPYKTILEYIKGLYSTEAHLFWKNNKHVFDQVKGNTYFTLSTIPFKESEYRANLENILSILLKNDEEKKDALKTLDSFKVFEPSNSYIKNFLMKISNDLENNIFNKDFECLAEILRFFNLFNISIKIDTLELLKKSFEKLKITDFAELLSVVYVLDKKAYANFIDKNKEEIQKKLMINYFIKSLIFESQKIKATYELDITKDPNKQTFQILQILYKLFPCSDEDKDFRYEVEVTDLYLWESIKNEGYYKKCSSKDLKEDSFSQRNNQLWIRRIQGHYSWESIYEFQKYWFDLRKLKVDCFRLMYLLIENCFSGNKKQTNLLDKKLVNKKVEISDYLRNERNVVYSLGFSKNEYDKKVESIDSWDFCTRNIINLLAKIDTKEKAITDNLENISNKLLEMQNSYNFIATNMSKYFSTEELDEEEKKTYKRFEITYLYLISNKNKIGEIKNSKKTIEEWSKNQNI